ncbi:hypothetical protein [Mycoplasma elephantis]|uniref:hypothetical protein n=1 Tax=Mycoplasma elephantis TaxID=114882 RepID=UPI00048717CB|nr:hypothetical protein [Mycoplasma elephantis]
MDVYSIVDNYVKKDKINHCFIFYSSKNVDIEQYMLYFFNKVNKSKYVELNYEQNYDNLHLVNFDNAYSSKESMVNAFQKLENKVSQDRYKFLMIKNLDEMSPNAISYILKLIEEPFPNSIIIISTRNISSLPKTIISRAILINVPPSLSKKEVALLDKKIKEPIYKNVLTNILCSYKEIEEFCGFFEFSDIYNILDVIYNSCKNKYILAAYIIEKMTLKNYYHFCLMLIFIFQEIHLRRTEFSKNNKEKFDFILESNLKIEPIIDEIYKFIKQIKSKYNFYLFKQVLIINTMRSYV